MFPTDAHQSTAEVYLTGTSTGYVDVAPEHGCQNSDVLDLRSPDRWIDVSPSTPTQGQCHSDPGALPLQKQVNIGFDHDAWVLGRKDRVNGGTTVRMDASHNSQKKTLGFEEAPHDAINTGALSKNAQHRRRPTRRLLPLWDSPSPRKVNTSRISAPHKCEIAQGFGTGRSSSVHVRSPLSPSGLQTQIHQDWMSTPASDPADSVSADSSVLEDQTSDSEIGSHEADEVCRDSPIDGCCEDDAPGHVSPCNMDHHLAIEEAEKEGSLDEPKQIVTGAQRRRLRRQQELELMQMNDPQGWFRLKQTMQAMMPYGWDKCVHQPATCIY